MSPQGKDLEEEKKKNTPTRSMFMNQSVQRVFRGWGRWAMHRGTERRV